MLLDGEFALAMAYTDERLRQFCSARDLARKLLVLAGGERTSILRQASGAPIWPTGFTGSISHSGNCVGVLLGNSYEWYGLGLDIEQLGRITPALWPLLFTAKEQQQIQQAINPEQAEFLATAFFAVKEAFLKLPTAGGERQIDYLDVESSYRDLCFVLHGKRIKLHDIFGVAALNVEVIIHESYVVAAILLE